MQGVCFQAVGQVDVLSLADPEIIDPRDAIVRVELAGLCGSDLHPFWGREPGLDPGTVMGHEFVGTVIARGEQVQHIQLGDRVCAPFSTNCGQCFYCHRGLPSRCAQGQLFGWRSHARGLHGGQAEMVRVPLADGTLMKIPAGISDEMALLLGDNLSTGYFCNELAGVGPDGVYVVIGCGNVGLMAIVSARLRGATTIIAVDPVESRRQLAESLGAIAIAPDAHPEQEIRRRTDGRGADGVLELVGMLQAQRQAYDWVRPGGVIATVGCHCDPQFAFSPVEAYDKNITYRTGRCPARHFMNELAPRMAESPIDLKPLMTHRFSLAEGRHAYDVFSNRREGCIKALFQVS